MATRHFKVGDHVRWSSEAGRVSGTITRVHTRDFEWKGYHRHSRWLSEKRSDSLLGPLPSREGTRPPAPKKRRFSGSRSRASRTTTLGSRCTRRAG